MATRPTIQPRQEDPVLQDGGQFCRPKNVPVRGEKRNEIDFSSFRFHLFFYPLQTHAQTFLSLHLVSRIIPKMVHC